MEDAQGLFFGKFILQYFHGSFVISVLRNKYRCVKAILIRITNYVASEIDISFFLFPPLSFDFYKYAIFYPCLMVTVRKPAFIYFCEVREGGESLPVFFLRTHILRDPVLGGIV